MSRLKVNSIIPFNDFGIGIGSPNNEASALLNIPSQTQGVLIPRMSTLYRDAISSPADGLLIYNLDTHAVEHYNSAADAWESTDGVQSINGLTSKIQLLTIDTAGLAPNWATTGGTTHILNLPFAHTPAVSAGLLTNGEYVSLNSRLWPMKQVLYVVQNAELGPQDFNSIKDAVDSITDASASKPYLISVGPGVYVENTITLQSYIWIQGAEQDQTIIQAANPNDTVIIGAPISGVSKCTITGSTGPSAVAVQYMHDSGTDKTSFFLEDVRFGTNTQHVLSDATYSPCAVFIEQGRLGGTHPFTTGFVAQNGGRLVVRNTTTTSVSTPVPADIFVVDGVGSELVLNGVQLRNGNAVSGNCIRMRDGAKLRALSFNIKNWAKGIWLENVGAACFIDVVGILCEGNTADLQADHPGSDGTFTGSADHNKITVHTSAALSVAIACNANPSDNTGSVTVGHILQGDRYDRLVNVSRLIRDTSTLGVSSGGVISHVSGTTINVSSGVGFVNVTGDNYIKEVSWSSTNFTLASFEIAYIYVTSGGVVQKSSAPLSLTDTIVLGRAVSHSGEVDFIEHTAMNMQHYSNKVEEFLRDALGPVFSGVGVVTSESATPLRVDTTAGSYYLGGTEISTLGGTEITFEFLYRDGLGGWTSSNTVNVSNTQYDDGSGTLASIPAGKYAVHWLYVVGQASGDKYHMVYSQDVYDSLAAARLADTPVTPSYFTDALVIIAAVIVQEGSGTIADILNVSPRIGFAARASSASSDHGSLSGLLDDDHPQYLLVSGTRAMTGALNMGTNNITNIGTANGVTIESHASRHLPSGADPLTTAAPVSNLSGDTVNAAGAANSLSKSDHSHAITVASAATLLPDQSNSTGDSAGLARGNHVHNVPTAAPTGTIGANSTNSQGVAASFSKSDHGHQLATGTPITIVPDSSNSAGTSNNLSRADHNHALPAGVPVTVGTANSKGSAVSVALSDHVHAHGNLPGGSTHDAATTSVNGYMSATDKTKLDGISGTRVFKSGLVSAGSFTGNPKKATVTFSTAFATANYTIAITGEDGRTWTYETKATTGFVINANANAALTGEVSWIAISAGESVE